MNTQQRNNAEIIRSEARALVDKRTQQARTESYAAFRKSGIPALFEDVELVLSDLAAILRYVLDGCKSGMPQIRPYTESLLRRMLTVFTCYQYDAWYYNEELTNDELLSLGMPGDDDEALVRYCKSTGKDTFIVEGHSCYAAQRKVIKAFFNYIRALTVFAKEIKSEKGVECLARAYGILVRYDQNAARAPYTQAQVEDIFRYIDEAIAETYVTWLVPQLPTLAALRKELGV